MLGEKKGERKVLEASTEEATLPNLQVEHCVLLTLILHKASGNERKHTRTTTLIFLEIRALYPYFLEQLVKSLKYLFLNPLMVILFPN